jgi:hypothetical protein
MPIERPLLVGEVCTNFCGWIVVAWSAQRISTAVNLGINYKYLLQYVDSPQGAEYWIAVTHWQGRIYWHAFVVMALFYEARERREFFEVCSILVCRRKSFYGKLIIHLNVLNNGAQAHFSSLKSLTRIS